MLAKIHVSLFVVSVLDRTGKCIESDTFNFHYFVSELKHPLYYNAISAQLNAGLNSNCSRTIQKLKGRGKVFPTTKHHVIKVYKRNL
jgi:hypothetical protein